MTLEAVEVHPVGTVSELARLRRLEARVNDSALAEEYDSDIAPVGLDAYRAALLKEEE